MTLPDARRRLSATHLLALRCLADGDDDLAAAERLGVPVGRVAAVLADAAAALHEVLTAAAARAPVTASPGGASRMRD